MNIQLRFGALADKIDAQLRDQGVVLPKPIVQRFQRLADAITLLSIRGYLSTKKGQQARWKLLKEIANAAKLAKE